MSDDVSLDLNGHLDTRQNAAMCARQQVEDCAYPMQERQIA